MRRFIPWILAVALVVPGCATVDALSDLRTAGAIDVAIAASIIAVDEALEQRDLILDAVESGTTTREDGKREFDRIGLAIDAVHAAIGAAEIARRAEGGAGVDALAGDIMAAVGNLYQIVRRELE